MAKNLKIPKGKPEAVNQRKIDNTMAKRKRTEGQTKHYTKIKDRATRTPVKIGDELTCSGGVSSSSSTSGTRRVVPVANPVISHVCG